MTKLDPVLHSVSPKLPLSHALSVFLAGAIILFIEIAGSKLLASVFGSGLYVWSAILTVTLFGIATGAWAGGRLADRWPSTRTLSLLWVASALTLGTAVPLRQLILPLSDLMDLRLGALLCAQSLFFLPLAFLAAVSPIIIKLAEPAKERLGRTVGLISALGTAGSCFGALITGYLLVPAFPLTRLFLYLSLALAFYGATLWGSGKKISTPLFVLVWAACLWLVSNERPMTALGNRQDVTPLETRQNLYAQTQVLQVSNAKVLFLDGILQGGTFEPGRLSISEYSPGMEILGRSAVPDAKDILVIGLGAGVLPSRFQALGLRVDVVDINPQVVQLCQKWFDLRVPKENLHVEDGRRFLRKSGKTYDLIILDAFSGEEVPSHLVTKEAFGEMREHLSPKGTLLMNYVGLLGGDSAKVMATLAATLRSAYPSVEVFALPAGNFANYILVAKAQVSSWSKTEDLVWGNGKKSTLAGILADRYHLEDPYPFLLTDDYCPLEWLDRRSRFAWRKMAAENKRGSGPGA